MTEIRQCNYFLGTDRCVLNHGHDGGHQDGKGHRWESPEYETYAVTIGDRDFPKWQETIRRVQQVAHIQASDHDAKVAEEKAAKDLLKSEQIGALLERVGLPRGTQDGESRRVDDYVFSVDDDNIFRIWINPPDMSPEMREAIYDDSWAYRDLSEYWGKVYGGGENAPYALAYHAEQEPAKLIDLQVWIADQFDRLEKNYADRVRHIEENKGKAKVSRPQPTEPERLYELLRALVDRALDDRGVGI